MLSKERLLHPATIIAVIALMVALSGVGYAASTIGTAQLKNNAVTTAKIKNNAVTTAKIKNSAVTSAKLGSNAVTSAKLAAGAVAGSDLGPNAVGTVALADGAVVAAKLAGGAVGVNAIANGAVDAAKLGNGSVTDEKLGPGAVTGAKIAGGTITAANIAPGQVVTGKGELVGGRLTLATSAGATALVALPGVGTIAVACSATDVPTVEITNTSGGALQMTLTVTEPGAALSFFAQESLASGVAYPVTNTGLGGAQVSRFLLATAAGVVATADVAVGTSTAPPGCDATGQGIVG